MTDIQQAHADLVQELHAFVAETYLYMHPGLELEDDDQFLELGVIDSLGFVELVEQVQRRYAISVDDIEITEENFGSIAALAGYIEGKRSG